MPDKFILHAPYKPTGDQPQAIEKLSEGIQNGLKEQVLLGVTGSGKTFTMANIIANTNRPTLVLAHNKTLAAQLCSEFREFFPENAVEYFVSYYDYYQPEAYIPGSDMYIEKDASINDEIDRLRHSATSALLERRDVIIVSSVSCIYSLGDPEEYEKQMLGIRVGTEISRDDLIDRLIFIRYERNDVNFTRNKFRVRGDTVEIYPAGGEEHVAVRVEFFGDEIDRITLVNTISGELIRSVSYYAIFPATHYVASLEQREKALVEIEEELRDRIEYFKSEGKLIEAQRIEQRTNYDLEMIREIGYCSGIENYSRVMSGRAPGSTPFTLLDFFPDDFLLFIDESHVTIPQVRGMSGGDLARKTNLVEYGFRLPSAYDNRPLHSDEFESKLNQTIYVSATPADYEKQRSEYIAEQLIRPTGLIDPEVFVRPVETQVEDLMHEIAVRSERGERILVTTLTTSMAEDLTEYFQTNGIKVKYIHHKIETIERTEIIRDLRLGVFDVLVGINLLREGLDIPEVSLVAILDADKEGFLRSETSLIQTIGRAARNVNGTVIMYADTVTRSMAAAIGETERRRKIQMEYNKENNITPKTIKKTVRSLPSDDVLPSKSKKKAGRTGKTDAFGEGVALTASERSELIASLEKEMKQAALLLEFERAAELRDRIAKLKKEG
ncbi:MAG: excinuclease ABC subunit UvrB [Clostridia bacterium]|nr:excinuclease ABC subunit UvrB [Clostridia bacterium]